MSKDWDNLIILDACRYDFLESHNDSDIENRIFESSNSEEFCDTYLSGRSFHDTVYITANPFGSQIAEGTFHKNVVTFDGNLDTNKKQAKVENITRGWDPNIVYQSAIESFEKYPNKRIMVHFMQPHAPYYGDVAETIRERLRESGFRFWAWNDDLSKTDSINNKKIVANLLSAAQKKLISVEELKQVYSGNLEIALELSKRLADSIPGKTIITSDHGEMLGEDYFFLPSDMGGMRNNIGHGRGIYTRELRMVPWLELNDRDRRIISKDEPVDSTDDSNTGVESQLKALGYK